MLPSTSKRCGGRAHLEANEGTPGAGPVTAEEALCHHEGLEDHEEKLLKFLFPNSKFYPFVTFVCFVVEKVFTDAERTVRRICGQSEKV